MSSMRPKPPSGKAKKILALILSIGIGIFAVYAIFFSDYFLINNFKVQEEGTMVDNNVPINEILKQYLGKNLVLLNENSLSQEIKSTHPEIENLRVKKILPKTLVVEFEKFPTVANIVNIVDGIQKKFLVDSRGFLTQENNENPDLPYIRITSSTPLQIHANFISTTSKSTERLNYIIQAINLYEEKFGMKILYAEFKIPEREIHLYTEKSFYVMIDMEKDLNTQLEKLKKVLTKLDIYNEPLVYIDLRISGTNNEKVIFKRRSK